jgi:hypothetical protein
MNAPIEQRLVQAPLSPAFGPEDLEGLPEPAQRHLQAAITAGTPLVRSVSLQMRGRIKIGRWLPFRARQVLSPHRGFIWRARAAGLIAGWDRYINGAGAMRWRLAGLVTVAAAEGPDVSRSAAGRASAEAIWVPTALVPRCGVRWTSTASDEATVHHDLEGTASSVSYRLDEDGRIASFAFDRWGDPDGTDQWGWHRFGGEIVDYRRFGGVAVPAVGRVGWHAGTERWPAGAFFEFAIDGLRALGL